jgi:glycosyltransferase involved in cell wall biosynthesis
MRVCIVGPAPPLRGGIACHTAGLAAALESRGHRVRVISYARLYPRLLFPGRSQVDGSAALGEARIDTLSPRSWIDVRRELAAESADLIVAQWWHPVAGPALLTCLGRERARTVVVCHNVRPHERTVAAAFVARRVLEKARAVVCHSAAIGREVAGLAPRLAREQAPMPLLVEPPAVSGPPAERASERPSALFLGLIRSYKGLDVLLRAWGEALLPEGATLTIAGESYLGRGRLERAIAATPNAGRIRLIDRYVSDEERWRLLLAAHALVLPYRTASQSGVLPLALAAGVRVIASDAGGLAEPLRGNPRHRVVGAGRIAELRSALEEVLWDSAAAGDAPQQRPLLDRGTVDRSWGPVVSSLERIASSAAPPLGR